jgi:hypothetical protein
VKRKNEVAKKRLQIVPKNKMKNNLFFKKDEQASGVL